MPTPLTDLGLSMDQLTLLGLGAGALVSVSTVPALIDAIIRPSADGRLPLARNCSSMAGNWAWTAFGLQSGHIPIVIFCGLSSVLLTTLSAFQIKRMFKKEMTHA